MAKELADITSYSFRAANLSPVSALVQRYGVKAVVYGGPGTAKTPLAAAVVGAVHGYTEAGLLSIRHLGVPAVMLKTHAQMLDYTKWCCYSQESKQFPTKCFDSFTQMSEIIHDEERHKTANGMKAYGEMATKMTEILHLLFFAENMNVIGIAKETLLEIEGLGKKYRPLFPGKMLDAAIPHLFDSIWRIEYAPDGKGGMQRVIRTKETFNVFARDRSGNLADLEPADLNYLIHKARQ
jgi:hypothetical protein